MPSPFIIGFGILFFIIFAVGMYFVTQSGGSSPTPPPPGPTTPGATQPASTTTTPVGSALSGSPPSSTSGAPLTPPPPPPASSYRLVDNTIAYRGDSNLGAKTIRSVSGDVNACKSACDAQSDCTHFERIGNSCTLYRGAEWVGGMAGGQSYCKAQCQQ